MKTALFILQVTLCVCIIIVFLTDIHHEGRQNERLDAIEQASNSNE